MFVARKFGDKNSYRLQKIICHSMMLVWIEIQLEGEKCEGSLKVKGGRKFSTCFGAGFNNLFIKSWHVECVIRTMSVLH